MVVLTAGAATGVLTDGDDLDGLFLPEELVSDDASAALLSDFGCLDEGVDEDDDGLVGDPESFLTFFSFSGGESGPFSTLGELASSFETSTTKSPSLFSVSLSPESLSSLFLLLLLFVPFTCLSLSRSRSRSLSLSLSRSLSLFSLSLSLSRSRSRSRSLSLSLSLSMCPSSLPCDDKSDARYFSDRDKGPSGDREFIPSLSSGFIIGRCGG